jgi:hypothetical protein
MEKPNGCMQRIDDKVDVGTWRSYESEYGNRIIGSVDSDAEVREELQVCG